MNDGLSPSASRAGRVLVALQLGLLLGLSAAAAPAFLRGRAPPAAWLWLMAGAAVGLWALSANRPGNFNIRPDPRPDGQLVQHGPYRWIRHPMYTSIGLWSLGCGWALGTAAGWAAVVALAVVLLAKARLEERGMAAAHAGYADYRRRTWRFIPGLF